jgi:hypothetical protein
VLVLVLVPADPLCEPHAATTAAPAIAAIPARARLKREAIAIERSGASPRS